jgi:hypothetical protein
MLQDYKPICRTRYCLAGTLGSRSWFAGRESVFRAVTPWSPMWASAEHLKRR